MLETKNAEIDIAQLLEKIGYELKLLKKSTGNDDAESVPSLPINDPYSWGRLSETLRMAEQNVNAGAEVTSMLHHRGFVRKFARFLGKVVVFLGRVITIPQRNFNAASLHCLRITLDGIRDMNKGQAATQYEMNARLEQLEKKTVAIDYLKTALAMQERRVSLLLDELRHQTADRTDGGEEQERPIESNIPDIHDALYLAFEDQFRGTRAEIRHSLEEYLPLITDAGAGCDGRPILDLGCGRGEWLEILKDQGLTARGVDMNDVLIDTCQQQGFDVVLSDALSYLRSLPDNSVGAVTAFHLIEHLDLETRIALFDECARVVKSGGVALFETPNPRNFLVGSCNFWADPTHMRPLYPETHQFLLEYRGFSNVQLLFLHPHDDDHRLPEDEAPQLAGRLNELFACARDYMVVGYKR